MASAGDVIRTARQKQPDQLPQPVGRRWPNARTALIKRASVVDVATVRWAIEPLKWFRPVLSYSEHLMPDSTKRIDEMAEAARFEVRGV